MAASSASLLAVARPGPLVELAVVSETADRSIRVPRMASLTNRTSKAKAHSYREDRKIRDRKIGGSMDWPRILPGDKGELSAGKLGSRIGVG